VEDLFQQVQYRNLRRQLPRDNILDAMVTSVTAVRAYPNYLTIPQQSEKEAKGLPIEMVYIF
jgi:predicted RNase H-like nuclease